MQAEQTSNRRKARENALSALFQIFLGNNDIDVVLKRLQETKKDIFMENLVRGVVADIENIDKIISDSATNWSLERFGNVEKNAIRIAVFELISENEDVTINIVLNEAIEIVKKYSDTKAAKFTNSVLQKIVTRVRKNDRGKD